MPAENDQHANIDEDKKNGRRKKGGDLHHLRPVNELKAGQKAKVKEKKAPAESPRTWPAPEVARVANILINGKRAHMSVLRGARIEFVFSNAEREGDPHDLAKAQRFSSTYSFQYAGKTVPQFVLKVSKPQWDRLPEDLYEEALYHYLLAFSTDSNGRWRIERPDIIAFAAEIQEFPNSPRWNKGLVRARQIGLFDGIASAELADSESRGKEVVR